MIRSVAVVPCPPLLVAHLAGAGTDAVVDGLRDACRRAVGALPPGRWHAVGVDAGGPATAEPGTTGDFRGYGIDVAVRLGAGQTPAAGLPLPLLVAAWLAGEAGAAAVTGEVVVPDLARDACLAHGHELAARFADGPDVGLLVVGDGSRLHDAPGAGRVDARAATFDDTAAAALADADAAALAALDPELAAELGADGRAAWQVLAGATGPWRGELLWSGAPYGVRYHVAVWRR